MGMSGAGRNEQTIARSQGDRGLAFLLPDAGAGNDVEGDRSRMKVSWIDAPRLIFGVIDGDFLVRRIGHSHLQQGRMRNHASPLGGGRLCVEHA